MPEVCRVRTFLIDTGHETEFNVLLEIHSLVGGRLAHISTVVKVAADKMVERAKELLEREKQWLLSKKPLIPDHDDDVMGL